MNKVILMGRLTRDPEVRYSQGEQAMAVARYTLAVDRRFRRDGDQQTADFINCVAFGRSGEFVEILFRKLSRPVKCYNVDKIRILRLVVLTSGTSSAVHRKRVPGNRHGTLPLGVSHFRIPGQSTHKNYSIHTITLPFLS